MIENAIDIQGGQQFSIASEAATAKLEPGFYDVWGDAVNALYIKLHQTDTTAPTSSTGYLVRADNTVAIRVTKESILSFSGTGALRYHRVG